MIQRCITYVANTFYTNKNYTIKQLLTTELLEMVTWLSTPWATV